MLGIFNRKFKNDDKYCREITNTVVVAFQHIQILIFTVVVPLIIRGVYCITNEYQKVVDFCVQYCTRKKRWLLNDRIKEDVIIVFSIK